MTKARQNADSVDKINLGDNEKLQLGDSDDLEIYHDGSHSRIVDQGTGNLKVQAADLELSNTGGYKWFKGVDNAQAELYHNNAKKLSTTSTGVDVTGTVTADGLTVEGDISANGYIDIPSYVRHAGDTNTFFGFPSNDDFRIYTNGNLRYRVESGGDISFYEDTGTTPKMMWDSSEEKLTFGGSINRYITSPSGSTEVRLGADNGSGVITAHTAGTERMRINSSGNVGIGTIDPQKTLHVNKNASESVILVDSSDTGDAGIYFGGQTDTIKAGFILDNSDNSLDIRGYNNSVAATVSSSLDWHFASQLYIPDFIYHSGDSNTYMQFHGEDRWRVVTNGNERLEVSNTGVIINEQGAQNDFRVESDSNTHMLFVNGSTNKVGINTSAPSSTLEVGQAGTHAAIALKGGDDTAQSLEMVHSKNGTFSSVTIDIQLPGANGYLYEVQIGSTNAAGRYQTGGGYTNGTGNFSHTKHVGSNWTVTNPSNNKLRLYTTGVGTHPIIRLKVWAGTTAGLDEGDVIVTYTA